MRFFIAERGFRFRYPAPGNETKGNQDLGQKDEHETRRWRPAVPEEGAPRSGSRLGAAVRKLSLQVIGSKSQTPYHRPRGPREPFSPLSWLAVWQSTPMSVTGGCIIAPQGVYPYRVASRTCLSKNRMSGNRRKTEVFSLPSSEPPYFSEACNHPRQEQDVTTCE